ncbi:MAG: hypothetical protein A2X08_05610 [Bacteroidetes bacterium GWA2_32_17]|nr:MAG: hypothetical protein A2X08_05610 [Bacteroidetes bacterium GWA2_32_17]
MSIASNLDKLKLINSEIKNEQTGTPDDFAKKLNISRSMFYNYIGEMKTLGAKIKYSRRCMTFYYENDFELTIEVNFNDNLIRKS